MGLCVSTQGAFDDRKLTGSSAGLEDGDASRRTARRLISVLINACWLECNLGNLLTISCLSRAFSSSCFVFQMHHITGKAVIAGNDVVVSQVLHNSAKIKIKRIVLEDKKSEKSKVQGTVQLRLLEYFIVHMFVCCKAIVWIKSKLRHRGDH